MTAIEFTTELTDAPTLAVPADVSARLPESGRVRVLVLTGDDEADDAGGRSGTYEQFLRGEPPEDAVYDALK